MGVREWPWWRLLIKITPMLNVHRTEDQLRLRSVREKTGLILKILLLYKSYFLKDELESLRTRFEKIEKERNDLKIANERLESKVTIGIILS